MREESNPLIKSCCIRPDSYRDVPATETNSIGLRSDPAFSEGRRAGAMFFARHLDYSITTQNSHPSPRLGTVKTASSCARTLQPSAGTSKNHATATRTPTNQTAGPLGLISHFLHVRQFQKN
jgi:hypothetical protein